MTTGNGISLRGRERGDAQFSKQKLPAKTSCTANAAEQNIRAREAACKIQIGQLLCTIHVLSLLLKKSCTSHYLPKKTCTT